MLTQKQIQMKDRLVSHFKEKHESSYDLIDIESLVDSNLTFDENKRIIQEEFDKLEDTSLKDQYQAYKEIELQMKAENARNIDGSEFWKGILPELKVIVILGDTRSGKTALSYRVLEQAEKPVYVYKHPNKEIISHLNYNPIYSLEALARIQDCLVWIDEPQLVLPSEDKKTNQALLKLISLAGQRGITLVFSTCEPRWVERKLEYYVNAWCIKDCEYAMLKNGSVAKRIIKDQSYISPDEFMLSEDQYLFYCRKHPELNGKKEFTKPPYFDERHSKPFRLENSAKTAEKTPVEIAESNELVFVGAYDLKKKVVGVEG